MECQEIRLGKESIDYVVECLKKGKSLASKLLLYIDFKQGSAKTFAPAQLDAPALAAFRTGGKFPTAPKEDWQQLKGGGVAVPIINADDYLARAIHDFLALSDQRLCIFENALAHPTDPYVHRLSSAISVFEQDVYHTLTAGDDLSRIQQTVREAGSIPIFIGAMTSWHAECPKVLSQHVSLTPSCLSGLAQLAQGVIVGAYDGESYVLWEKGC